ncbi:MAG TPA: APC family permease [Haliangiales bacterium]|nr:APC family permease [Haliangiales bacterium]
MDDPTATPPQLRRAMGFWDVVLFFVAAVVGLRWIATAAAVGPSSLVVWLIAFVAFFVPLAFTVVELSGRYPEEGGLYIWVKRAFGDFAGFIAGWMYWTSNLVYFPGLLYFSAGNALFMGGSSWQALSDSAPYYMVASLAGLGLALALNLVGLGVGKWLHNAGGVGTWIPVGLLVVMGAVAWARFGPAQDFGLAALAPTIGVKEIVFWSTIAFGFGGFEAASFMSEEIVDARRVIPRAIAAAGAIITGIYVLGTAAVLVALPPGDVSSLQGIMQAIARTGERIGLPAAGAAAALLITIGNVGGVGAWLASTARLPFVAGIDRYLPPAFARLHPRWGTPYVALIVQAAGAALFVVLGQAGTNVKGAYDFLVGLGVISYFIPYLMMFAAMIVLQREPAPAGTLRVPGGRPVAILLASVGLATTAISIVLAALPPEGSTDPALAVVKVVGSGVGLLALGVLLFGRAWLRARRAR